MKYENKNVKSVFAERLRELRQDKNLSAKQLGVLIGYNDSSIILWENCKRLASIEALYKIADFFGVTADYLIGLED